MIEGLVPPWLVEEILTIPLSKSLCKDKLVWMHNKSGKFTVKLCYHMLHECKEDYGLSAASFCSQVQPLFWKELWKLKIATKVKLFIWKAMGNHLPTEANLQTRKIIPESMCPIWEDRHETLEHVLLGCSWSMRIWFLAGMFLNHKLSNVQKFSAWF